MSKLSTVQLLLLTSAAARPDGSLLPPPDGAGAAAPVRRAIPPLLKRGFAEEVAGVDDQRTWRQEGETRFGVMITAAGRAAVGADAPVPADPEPALEEQAPEPATATHAPTSKAGLLLDLMRQDSGATLVALAEATGWLPHTTRAALTACDSRGMPSSVKSRMGSASTGWPPEHGSAAEHPGCAGDTLSSAVAHRGNPRLGTVPQGFGPDLLRLALAYTQQATTGARLPPHVARELRAGQRGQRAGTSASPLRPGTQLVREWQGRTYQVQVTETGFLYRERAYRSLSAISCEITGAKWSGPRFFGLTAERGQARSG